MSSLSRRGSENPGTVLHFPLPLRQGPVTRAEVEQAVARGRGLQGQALRNGIRRAFSLLAGAFLAGGCLRGLRLTAGTAGRRQPCC
ncbi:hypothetical protein [Pelagibius sp. 7325]|uniref:hypothetical protein n=1 Tax=Pelagibius sp. 7325 TaxID=3131994 RepID=UPI0030EF085C